VTPLVAALGDTSPSDDTAACIIQTGEITTFVCPWDLDLLHCVYK